MNTKTRARPELPLEGGGAQIGPVKERLLASMRATKLTALVLVVAVAPPAASGQQPILYHGARVRLTWSNPPRWINATVDNPASRSLSLAAAGENLGTIIINESTRLQLYQGRRSPTKLGAVIGALVGGSVSGILFHDDFGKDGTAFATSQAVLVGAAVGAITGGLLSWRIFGQAQWVDLPIVRGRIVYPSLERSDTNTVSFATPQWWTRFEVTEPAFSAFFQEYQPRLHGVEGIYRNSNRGDRIAIVRDDRFSEYQYVMVNLLSFPTPRALGAIIGAIRITGPSHYEICYLPNAFPQRMPATLTATSLDVQLEHGYTEQWVRAN